jgi:hypothetical protein
VQAKRFAAIPIIAAGFMAIATAHAETFTFDKHQIILEPPKGYCALDAGRPEEQAIIENQKALQSAYNEVAMVFVACADLEKLRARQLDRIDDMGSFQIVKQAGRISAVSGFSRPAYLAEIAKSMPQFDSQAVLDETVARIRNSGNGAMNVNTSGMLAQDRSAIYFGGMATMTRADGSSIPKIFVSATTLIDALGVAMSIGRPSAAETDLQKLLAEQRENAAALIQANAAIDITATNPQGGGFDMPQLLRAVVIAALLGGGIGLVTMLVKRAAKRRSADQPEN